MSDPLPTLRHGRFTDAANNAKLDLLFGGVRLTPPATWWVALSAGPPRPDGPLPGEELEVAGYSRRPIPNTPAAWPRVPGDMGQGRSNGVAVSWPSSDRWPRVVSLALYDAPTGGACWAVAWLTVPLDPTVGGPSPTISPGAIHVQDT